MDTPVGAVTKVAVGRTETLVASEGGTSLAPTGGPAAQYLSPEGVAAHLGVPVNTVRDWRRRGLLPPALKLGRLVRWPVKTIDDWAKSRQERSGRRPVNNLQLTGQSFHNGRL